MGFTIHSEALEEGGAIPKEYTCDGSDLSPPLEWDGAPYGTRSYALIVEDPDAPMGTFIHWVVYDIPAGRGGLSKGTSTSALLDGGIKQGTNDFGRTGYGGPCPPRGHGRHPYFFRLLALYVETLGLPPGASRREVERAFSGHLLGEAVLMGTYSR